MGPPAKIPASSVQQSSVIKRFPPREVLNDIGNNLSAVNGIVLPRGN